jgi:hypothetical protein
MNARFVWIALSGVFNIRSCLLEVILIYAMVLSFRARSPSAKSCYGGWGVTDVALNREKRVLA